MPRELVTDPIYKQVSDLLMELATTGYSHGQQFLTEREVSQRYGISRTTANKALANLVVDGILEFRKGVGTFVARPKLNVDLKRLVSFTEKARAAGLTPETVVRSFRRTPVRGVKLLPQPVVASLLEVQPSAPVYEIERVRLINGEPVVYERRCLLAMACPDLNGDDLAGSLYAVFAGKYELELEGVAQRVRARVLDPGEAALLGVTPGTAALELTGVGHLADGSPLWYEETLYRGDKYEFVNQVTVHGDEHQSVLGPTVHVSEEDAQRHWYRWETEGSR